MSTDPIPAATSPAVTHTLAMLETYKRVYADSSEALAHTMALRAALAAHPLIVTPIANSWPVEQTDPHGAIAVHTSDYLLDNMPDRVALDALLDVPLSVLNGAELIHTTIKARTQELRTRISFESQVYGRSQHDTMALAILNLGRAFQINAECGYLHGYSTVREGGAGYTFGAASADAAPLIATEIQSAPDQYAGNGLFAQLSATGSKCLRHTAVKRAHLRGMLFSACGQMFYDNGVVPDVVYCNTADVSTEDRLLLAEPPYAINMQYSLHIPPGEILLVTSTLSPALAAQLAEEGLTSQIPAPASLALAVPHVVSLFPPYTPHWPVSIVTIGAVRVHLPQYFGWISLA